MSTTFMKLNVVNYRHLLIYVSLPSGEITGLESQRPLSHSVPLLQPSPVFLPLLPGLGVQAGVLQDSVIVLGTQAYEREITVQVLVPIVPQEPVQKLEQVLLSAQVYCGGAGVRVPEAGVGVGVTIGVGVGVGVEIDPVLFVPAVP